MKLILILFLLSSCSIKDNQELNDIHTRLNKVEKKITYIYNKLASTKIKTQSKNNKELINDKCFEQIANSILNCKPTKCHVFIQDVLYTKIIIGFLNSKCVVETIMPDSKKESCAFKTNQLKSVKLMVDSIRGAKVTELQQDKIDQILSKSCNLK